MNKILCHTAVIAITAMGISTTAQADSVLDAAIDERGQAVVDERGNCVRTKWKDRDDICAPPAPPKPKAVIPPPPVPPKNLFTREEGTVYFEFDSSALSPTAKGKIRNVAALINKAEDVHDVKMVGYTDQIGTSSYNQALSKRRVEAVRDYLAPQLTISISPDKTEFRAAGEAPDDNKCDDAKTREEKITCMRYQRRVEIELLREVKAR